MRELPQPLEPKARPREVYTVSQLNGEVRRLLEASYPEIWVEGEVSNLSCPGSGHVYFSLKDAGAQVRCALFRTRRSFLSFEPREGAHVLVRARVTVYENRGDYQLVVQYVEEAGEGALRRALERLKQNLSEEGLFDPAHKQPLPRFPRRVGIITSPTGAAIRDIVTTFRRRCPAIPLLLYPTTVQGETAEHEIVRALTIAARRRECDVLILARGGGSLEDLWPFNSEQVARAIHHCPLPVVSGIGHEIDVTISDLVADQRAATPTAAAELLSPDVEHWLALFSRTQVDLTRIVRRRLESTAQQVDWLARRLVHPRQRIGMAREQLGAAAKHLAAAMFDSLKSVRLEMSDVVHRLYGVPVEPGIRARQAHVQNVSMRLGHASGERVARERYRLREASARLQAVSPLATLARGFAVVSDPISGRVLTRATDVATGADVDVRLAHGGLRCAVKEVRKR